tara:strand:- start:3669 stop:4319 length:651 start_codon:yes stop_codon:yes gene_type:complete
MISPNRHDLPAPLVAADAPLSSDVMSRSLEALQYVWQVTTGCIDAAGTPTPTPQGHTHDGKNDQSLFASSQYFAGWPCGFASPVFRCDSDAAFVSPVDPKGGWVAGLVAMTVARSVVHIPFDVAAGSPACASFSVVALVEKGSPLSAANAVTVSATVGGATLTATSAAAAVGLELITVGPFAAGAINGGPQELSVSLSSLLSNDWARLWHVAVVTL